MKSNLKKESPQNLVEQVDALNEEVRVLALNLAIYLAKVKNKSNELGRLEPDFIRLVNGTVKVVKELTVVINAARNTEDFKYSDNTSIHQSNDLIENKLHNILDQCTRILTALSVNKKTGC
ncbi:MAG: hypothetical protein ABIJ12_13950 [bacterium]